MLASLRKTALGRTLTTRYDPLTSLVFTIPVFLFYHVGILFLNVRNGVDLVSMVSLELIRQSVLGYLALTFALAGAIAATAWFLKRRESLRPKALVPVLIESLVASVLMLVTVGWATSKVTFEAQIAPNAPALLGPFAKLVMSAGAGFHEELVFRVGLFGGLVRLAERVLKVRPWMRTALAAVVAALVFSAIHYIGALSDAFDVVSFVSRFLAGLFLTLIYRWRGFAVAVYTHAFYDVIIMLVLH